MNPHPRRGEVFWITFGPSIGGEIQKTRPAVVVSNDDANRSLNRALVVPLTSNTDRLHPGEALVTVNGVVHKAMANQLTTSSALRFRARLGLLSEADLYVESAMIEQLGLGS